MQFVKTVTNQSWWILDKIFPDGVAFLMQQTQNNRMEAVATYLADQIKVENNLQLKIGFIIQNYY